MMMDPASSSAIGCLTSSQPPRRMRRENRGSVASRYLAAISRSVSHDSEPQPSFRPQHSFPPPSNRERKVEASPAVINSVSPKSTRTERTVPLDQSATSGSSCEDQQANRRRPRNTSHVSPQRLFNEQDVSASKSSKSPTPASRKPLRRRPTAPPAIRLDGASERNDSSDNSTASSDLEKYAPEISAKNGELNRRRAQSLTESLSDGLRFIWDAKQLWAGCDVGGNQVNVSLDASEGSTDAPVELSNGSALRRTYSEIKSEVTTASTQIATNRAVDVARRRVVAHHALSAASRPSDAKPFSAASSSKADNNLHPTRYSFGEPSSQWNPAQLEAKSVLSVSSNDESSSRAAWSHDDHAVPPYSRVASASCPQHCQQDSMDRCMRNIALPPAAPPPSSSQTRLSRHISMQGRETKPANGNKEGSCEESYQSQSHASSNNVEINNSAGRPRMSSFHRAKATFQRRLFLNELPVKALPEEPDTLPPESFEAGDAMQTKNFTLSGRLRKPFSTEDVALSPPQIQRTTGNSQSPPDPIFCTHPSPSRSVIVTGDAEESRDSSTEAPVGSYGALKESAKLEPGIPTVASHNVVPNEKVTMQPLLPDRIAPASYQQRTATIPPKKSQVESQSRDSLESHLATDSSGSHELFVPTLSKQFSRRNLRHPVPRLRQVEAHDRGADDGAALVVGKPSDLASSLRSDSPVDASLCSPFLAAVSKFESLKTKPSFTSVRSKDVEEEEKTAFGKSSPPLVKSRSAAFESSGRSRRGLELTLGRRPPTFAPSLTADQDDDTASVKSICEKLEASNPAFAEEDLDDDVGSVKSIREKFEPAVRKVETENSVSRIRAKFEAKRPPSLRQANGALKDAISRFEAPFQGPLKSTRFLKRVTSNSSVESRQEQVVKATVTDTKESAVYESISDRIQAFSFSSQAPKYSRMHQIASPTSRDSASIPTVTISLTNEVGNSTGHGTRQAMAELSRDEILQRHWGDVAHSTERHSLANPLEKAKNREQKQEQPPLPHGARSSNGEQRRLKPSSKLMVPAASVTTSTVEAVASVDPLTKATSTKPTATQDRLLSKGVASRANASTEHQPPSFQKLRTDPDREVESSWRATSESVAQSCNESNRFNPAYSSKQRERTLQAAHAALNKHETMLRPIKNEFEPLEGMRASPDGAVAGDYDQLRVPSSLRDQGAKNEGGSDDDDSGSEFSDGVTLDLSIADVSNLTTPTALVSRADRSVATEDGDSSDPGSKSLEHVDAEAKRSEASSSQTSEAAAPLLAKALGLLPKSDELSASSFFGKRALIANHWSKTSTLDGLAKAATDSRGNDFAGDTMNDDAFGSGWDLTRIETSFPVKESSAVVDLFTFDSEWRLLPAPGPRIQLETKNKTESSGCEPLQVVAPTSVSTTSFDVWSRAKTPTRSNTSARAQPASPSHRGERGQWLSSGTPPTPSTVSGRVRGPAVPGRAPAAVPFHPATAASSHRAAATTSEARSNPPQARDSSTWKRRAGVTLSSLRRESHLQCGGPPVPVAAAIERLPIRLPPTSLPPSTFSTTTTATTTTLPVSERLAGRHAALMNRLRALKEARLRRMGGVGAHPDHQLLGYENALPDPDDTSHSTQSSTQFGGSTFFASLEVD